MLTIHDIRVNKSITVRKLRYFKSVSKLTENSKCHKIN